MVVYENNMNYEHCADNWLRIVECEFNITEHLYYIDYVYIKRHKVFINGKHIH